MYIPVFSRTFVNIPAQAYLLFDFLVLGMEMLKKTSKCALLLLRGFALGPSEGGGEVAGSLAPFQHPGSRARSWPSLGLLLRPHGRCRRTGNGEGGRVLPISISAAELQQFLHEPVVSLAPFRASCLTTMVMVTGVWVGRGGEE